LACGLTKILDVLVPFLVLAETDSTTTILINKLTTANNTVIDPNALLTPILTTLNPLLFNAYAHRSDAARA